MLPETHPLIEAVTKPLANNAEQRLAANVLLGENFDPHHPGAASGLATLEASEGKVRPAIWKGMLWALAGLALGLAIFSHMSVIRLVANYNGPLSFEPPDPLPLPAGLSEQERLLLGDPALPYLRQKELLYQSDPANPAYFAEYAQAYVSEHETLPPGFLETAARIDPGNSFFVYYAAGQVGGRSVEIKRSPSPSAKPRFSGTVRLSPLPREWEYSITDQEAYDEAMVLLEKAAELPGFRTYITKLIAERARLITYDTFDSYAQGIGRVYGSSSGVISLGKAERLLSARAGELSRSGETDRFLGLARQREAFLSAMAHNEDVLLVNELVYVAITSSSAVAFHAAADRLALPELADQYRKEMDALIAERDRGTVAIFTNQTDIREKRPSSIAETSLGVIQARAASSPPLRVSDLEPMRLVEHDFITRIGLIATGLLLIPCALLVFLLRFLSPRGIRLPAKRLGSLLNGLDWAWVFMLGVVLPVAAFLIINRLTPMSGRGYGVGHFELAFPGVHLVAVLMWLLIAPVVAVRWRLSQRLAAFGFGFREGWVGLAVLGILLLWSLGAFALVVTFGLTDFTRSALAVPPALGLFILFLDALRAYVGKAQPRIIRTATMISVLPAYPLGIIALCMTLPIYFASEKHWMAEDSMFRIKPDAPDLGAYEYKVAAQLRKETNAILGFE